MIHLAFLHSIGLNHKQLFLLFKDNQNYQEIFEKLDHKTLQKIKINDEKTLEIMNNYKNLKKENIEEKITKLSVKIIDYYSSEYPEELKNISNPPFLIYLRGELGIENKFSVVGARNFTSYGKKAMSDIVPDISKYFTIVSGGALGCDSEAHKITVENNAKTIVVVGTGIDISYPATNKNLFENIIGKGGGIISIFSLGEPANPYNFPIRNEIVAGLGVGTLVVEARKKSGSLITANLSLDLGKDLFAIPGDIGRVNSIGCNNLIKSGSAKLVGSANDILEEYSISENKSKKELNFENDLEKNIYHLLELEALSVDKIGDKLKLDTSSLSFSLSMMEIRGIIFKGEGGKYFIK